MQQLQECLASLGIEHIFESVSSYYICKCKSIDIVLRMIQSLRRFYLVAGVCYITFLSLSNLQIDYIIKIFLFAGCPIRTMALSNYHSLDRRSAYGVQTTGHETITRVQGVSGRGIQSIPVSQLAYFFIDMHGKNWKLSDVEVDVQGFPSPPAAADPLSPSAAGGGGGNNRVLSCSTTDADDSVFTSEGGGLFVAPFMLFLFNIPATS